MPENRFFLGYFDLCLRRQVPSELMAVRWLTATMWRTARWESRVAKRDFYGNWRRNLR